MITRSGGDAVAGPVVRISAVLAHRDEGLRVAARSASFRLRDEARRRLHERAEREGVNATALLGRLIIEGVGGPPSRHAETYEDRVPGCGS